MEGQLKRGTGQISHLGNEYNNKHWGGVGVKGETGGDVLLAMLG